jgi:hypothetical protein
MPWLKSAPFDLAMAFGWVPFYAWLLTTPVVGDVSDAAFKPAFKAAVAAALAINFVHRHFVYFLFFGDANKRAQHPRALWLAPLVAAGLVFPAKLLQPHIGRVAFDVVLFVLGAWNIWHVLMQRHGIARAYAARSGGALMERAHGRRDLALLASWILATAGLVIVFKQDTFYGPAKRAFAKIAFVNDVPFAKYLLVIVPLALAAYALVVWLRAELPSARIPRLTFIFSSACLLLVFVVHGPIVGYIVFGFAHSVEYILFVYLFSQKRVNKGERAWGVRALGTSLPIVGVSLVLFALFLGAREIWTVPLFVAYYSTTSILHYVYDGLIWKMRRPKVRAPLMTT